MFAHQVFSRGHFNWGNLAGRWWSFVFVLFIRCAARTGLCRTARVKQKAGSRDRDACQ
jgi:hypothetical protein